jgi:hypothetical protein
MVPDARLAMVMDAANDAGAVPGIECLHAPLAAERLLALLQAAKAGHAPRQAAGDDGA